MLAPHNKMRGRLMLVSMALTPVVAAGFCVAKIKGGTACSTYPFVGNKWSIDDSNFSKDIPYWNNFVENQLVAQWTHRNLATLLAIFVTWQTAGLMTMSGLTAGARVGSGLLLTTIWT